MNTSNINVTSGIILLVRFLLEIITVIGIFIGTFLGHQLAYKIGFFLLSIMIVIVWSKYGAPKSPVRLHGTKKLILEVSMYMIGTISFYIIFGMKMGLYYPIIAFTDLGLLYLLKLQNY
ncbi:YrdB family protein [Convivina praedatoris]|uniref:ATP synthase protein I n=1 Tax=Convivina praedatoris TaxID=2880963 RepID=A0ABM9D598_9LACO|nr:YrdB family protein [Convivina sp. LMG 32447]CAH1855896.1 hypothetical protein R077815_01303 [Convivina sp. LMG 32447]CAH1856611.1 hypothetical protein LMG032447_01327 [Convivina sp. LMG 32447]CAH1856863.1 hypothetical protein R078138_01456 [Convivina sp. LMG 32447]